MFEKHKNRVKKITEFVNRNKVFLVMVVIVAMLLYGGYFLQNDNTPPFIVGDCLCDEDDYEDDCDCPPVINNDNFENVEHAESVELKREGWRFYFIDVVILAAGGGFCLVMIIRERKRTKHKI
jgi:hypothetical protein